MVASPSTLPPIASFDDPKLEALIETMFLAAFADDEFSDEERAEFLCEMGLTESGLVRLTREAYALLNLITFFTAGETESRAWPIPQNTKAPQAAGKIHSDMERGFIRAEVYCYDDLLACGSEGKVKEKGLFRLEGKEYVIQEADIVYFRFNV